MTVLTKDMVYDNNHGIWKMLEKEAIIKLEKLRLVRQELIVPRLERNINISQFQATHQIIY